MAKHKFIEEYKEFIAEFIYPIMGHPYEQNSLTEGENTEVANYSDVKVISENSEFEENIYLIFNIPTRKDYIKAKIKKEIPEDILSLIKNICTRFASISKYQYNNSTNRKEISLIHQKQQYEYAVQLGICNWIYEEGEKIEELLHILENWSKKTYEGRKVSYSIIIDTDRDNTETKNNEFFSFLKDEFSATLTDSISSAFLIDAKGNLIKYLSITDKDNFEIVKEYQLVNSIPFRFSNLIYKEVVGKRIGIFLLSNGDILISKNRELILVKRNGRWLNCQYSSFYNALSNFQKNINENLVKQIFSTMLDISFSHTGGLIAFLCNDTYLKGTGQIIDSFDQLTINMSDDELKKQIKQKNPSLTDNEAKKEARKRKLKKEIIQTLLGTSEIKFERIERKLRSELAALDGACIINQDGNVVAVGTIIQNDSGSSGGGRSAAAKKLSLEGFAVKISSDGYIEVFENGKIIYEIK